MKVDEIEVKSHDTSQYTYVCVYVYVYVNMYM